MFSLPYPGRQSEAGTGRHFRCLLKEGASSKEQCARFGFIRMGVLMRALLGYLVGPLILLGGGYAALDWLVAPENRPAVTEMSPREAKNVLVKSPTETAAVPEPSEADRKRNAGTTAEPASTEQSDQASHKDAGVRPRSSDAVEAAPSYNDGASGTSSNSKSNIDARQRKLGKRNAIRAAEVRRGGFGKFTRYWPFAGATADRAFAQNGSARGARLV